MKREIIPCEFCNTEKTNQLGLCSGCGRFGRDLKECLNFYDFNVPESRIDDLSWLRRNIQFQNSDNPEISRVLNILKTF